MAFEKVPGTGSEDYHHVEYGRGLGPHDALDFEVSDFEWGRDDAMRRRAAAAAQVAEILTPVISSQTLVSVL
jgi:hypothetical protein